MDSVIGQVLRNAGVAFLVFIISLIFAFFWFGLCLLLHSPVLILCLWAIEIWTISVCMKPRCDFCNSSLFKRKNGWYCVKCQRWFPENWKSIDHFCVNGCGVLEKRERVTLTIYRYVCPKCGSEFYLSDSDE